MPQAPAGDTKPLDPERCSADRAEHLLLVVDLPAAVGGHPRRVVGGNEECVDVTRRDGQSEVVADEAAVARYPVPGAGDLGQTVDCLQRLGRVPRILRDPEIAAHGHGPEATVL